MVFQLLLCDECYENVYTYRRTNYLSFECSVIIRADVLDTLQILLGPWDIETCF
jgi:hypothetical protein